MNTIQEVLVTMNNHKYRLFVYVLLVFLCLPAIGMQHKKPANIPPLNLPPTATKPTPEMARRYGYCSGEYSDSDDSDSEDIKEAPCHFAPTMPKANPLKKILSPEEKEELKLAQELSIIATIVEQQTHNPKNKTSLDKEGPSYYDLFIEKKKSLCIGKNKQQSHHSTSAPITHLDQEELYYKTQPSNVLPNNRIANLKPAKTTTRRLF